MEVLILALLGVWLVAALRKAPKGGCGGNCSHCAGCGRKTADK